MPSVGPPPNCQLEKDPAYFQANPTSGFLIYVCGVIIHKPHYGPSMGCTCLFKHVVCPGVAILLQIAINHTAKDLATITQLLDLEQGRDGCLFVHSHMGLSGMSVNRRKMS